MGQVISVVEQYMNINKYQMGENIYLSSLIELINNVGGVLNVVDLRIYNKLVRCIVLTKYRNHISI
jgi:hypothetical protein